MLNPAPRRAKMRSPSPPQACQATHTVSLGDLDRDGSKSLVMLSEFTAKSAAAIAAQGNPTRTADNPRARFISASRYT